MLTKLESELLHSKLESTKPLLDKNQFFHEVQSVLYGKKNHVSLGRNKFITPEYISIKGTRFNYKDGGNKKVFKVIEEAYRYYSGQF